MTRIGIIGIGFMGYTHFEAARSLKGATVSAVATRSERKLAGDWTGIQGNFGPPAGKVDLSGINTYVDYSELINDPAVDLVDICLPTDRHFEVVMASLKAGKPTLVEKPISVDEQQAREMVEYSRKSGVPLFVGHVLPYFPEFRFAADAVASGKYGALRGAHFRRVICPPDWSSDMADFRKLGGWGVDLHIHDNHFIALACGRPDAVFSRGLLHDGLVNHVHTSYIYEDGPAVTCVSGGIAAKGLAFGHGFELYLDEATIVFDAGTYAGEWTVNRPLSLILNDGKVTTPELSGADEWCSAFTHELQTAVDSLNGSSEPGAIDSRLALDALQICNAEAKSIADGTVVSL